MNPLKLTTKGDVEARIEDLRVLVADGLLEAEHTKPALDKLEALRTQLRTGDYIVLEPDLSGWRYITHHYELPDEGEREREYNMGHQNVGSVAALAQRTGLPVVISDGLERWREHTADRLRKAGIIAITDMEG